METHSHKGKVEIHEVMNGEGEFYLGDQKFNYQAGRFCVIPSDIPHKVVAGKKGLYLLAAFSPALQ